MGGGNQRTLVRVHVVSVAVEVDVVTQNWSSWARRPGLAFCLGRPPRPHRGGSRLARSRRSSAAWGWTRPRRRLRIRDAAARADAREWLGPRAHPGGLGVRNARNAPRRTRKRALSLVAHQCKLRRTACDRSGTRRVGRARRGGAGRPCSADACEEGPSPRACKSPTSCTSALGCGATHGGGTSPAGPTGDRHDAHVVSREHVPHRDGGLRVARRTRALGRHDGDHRRQKSCARKRVVGAWG